MIYFRGCSVATRELSGILGTFNKEKKKYLSSLLCPGGSGPINYHQSSTLYFYLLCVFYNVGLLLDLYTFPNLGNALKGKQKNIQSNKKNVR